MTDLFDTAIAAKLAGSGGGSAPVLHELGVRVNGTYNASDDNCDGFSKVTVNVPADTKAITVVQNGVYNAALEGKDGYSQVTVNVPHEDVVLFDLDTSGGTIASIRNSGASKQQYFTDAISRCQITANGDFRIAEYHQDISFGAKIMPYAYDCPIEIEFEIYDISLVNAWCSIFSTHMSWNRDIGGWYYCLAVDNTNHPTAIYDSYGQTYDNPDDYEEVWAQISDLSALTINNRGKFKFRWWYDSTDNDPYKMSIYINDRLFTTIKTSNNDAAKGMMTGMFEPTNKPVIPLTIHSYKITAKYSESYT